MSMPRLAIFIVFACMIFPATLAYAGSQTFTSSGTFTVPNYESLTVTVNGVGGGGGGGGGGQGTSVSGKSCAAGNIGSNGTSGTGGSSTSFGSTVAVVGNGGGGGGGGSGGGGQGGGGAGSTGSAGTASGGDINTTGGGASGGGGGSGGTSSATAGYNGGSGGAGGQAVKTWAAGSDGAPSPGAGITVTVGSDGGGAGGPGGYGDCTTGGNGTSGSSGSAGSVAITWTVTTNTAFTKNMTIQGTLAVTEDISKGSGSFVIDHPLDPKNKLLYHSFLESPYAMNMYDGVADLDSKGEATIALPKYFEALNKDFRYQLKPIGKSMPNLFVKNEVDRNLFVIGGGTPGGRVSWQITGIRHDPYILANPIIPEVEKGPEELVDKGQYLFADAYQRSPFFSGTLSLLKGMLSGLLGFH